MKKKCVLISGPTIANDQKLGIEIKKYAVVLTNSDNRQLFSILKVEKIELILFEIVKENLTDIEFIREAKSSFPEILIILIDGNGNSNLIAKAFQYGAKDAFRKPYKYDLIEERVRVLLNIR